MSKSYCVKCKKEVGNDVKECECGCRTFVYGNVAINDAGKIVCKCGCDSMSFSSHLDYSDKAIWTYQCAECKAAIGKEYCRSKKELMYWGDC